MSLSYDVKVLSPASGAVRGAPFTDFPRYGFETYEIALMGQACFFVAFVRTTPERRYSSHTFRYGYLVTT